MGIRIWAIKTMFFIIDGLYGNDNVDGPPTESERWRPSTMLGRIVFLCRLME